jgi:hypothetical protein
MEFLLHYFACFVVAILLQVGFVAHAQGLPDEQLVEIGRQIYQHGYLPSGEPVKAVVLGDVEVSGAHFTCLNCHRRSGLGGPEGTKYVLPTNGKSLLSPRTDIYMSRPAYDEQSFAQAMRSGQGPGGEFFDSIMPQFELSNLQMSALFAYLKTISNDFSPGLSDEVLHVATVVSENVSLQDRQAMLGVIEKFFTNKNAETRHEKKRYKSGPFYQEYRNKAYRRWNLHLWELTGSADSWQEQLDSFYQQQPVFAILSGMVDGSWEPIHQFSEKNRIPCILPNTDRPVVEQKNGFYTMYYSKGLRLEAQVLSEQIQKEAANQRVLQIYRAGTDGAAAAIDLTNALPTAELSDFILPSGSDDWLGLAKSIHQLQPDRLVLWLDAIDLQSFALATDVTIPSYLSSSLLDGEFLSVPEELTKTAQMIHLFNLPKDHRARFLRVAAWMRVNKVPLTNQRLQGQSYYACMLLNAGMKHIKRFFYREFFLDLLDHGERMAAYSGNYPRLSFGPEQRFLAKGAYIVDLQSRNAEWVVPNY